ncbi:MAG: hypothetical protein Q4F25_02510 [Eubacteriales bacterium]|nr:hypothetical protein [Eubacteriales bacterium]
MSDNMEELDTGLGTEPDNAPGTELNNEPGTEPGTELSDAPGTEPDAEHDTELNTDPIVKKRGHRKLWIALLVVLLIAGGLGAVWWKCPVTNVYVRGNSYYTSEEIAEKVIRDDNILYRNSVFLMLRYMLPGTPPIPFEEKVSVRLLGPETVVIDVLDKEMAGYIPYAGRNLYFDADGIVKESSPLTVRGVTYVKGLDVSEANFGERIKSEDEGVLELLLTALGTIRKYEISADSILIDSSGSITLYFDEIKILIGRTDYELKISKIAQIMPYMDGRSGTIDMVNYSSADESIILR